jgi:hypothetical protein
MDNPFPPWTDWGDERVGRHVTCGELLYRVIAGDSMDPDLLLVIRSSIEPLWISLAERKAQGWHFISVLDEIRMAS